jgi:hypothetical protein
MLLIGARVRAEHVCAGGSDEPAIREVRHHANAPTTQEFIRHKWKYVSK